MNGNRIIYSTFPFRVVGFQLHHLMLRMIGVVVRHTQKALLGERPVQSYRERFHFHEYCFASMQLLPHVKLKTTVTPFPTPLSSYSFIHSWSPTEAFPHLHCGTFPFSYSPIPTRAWVCLPASADTRTAGRLRHSRARIPTPAPPQHPLAPHRLGNVPQQPSKSGGKPYPHAPATPPPAASSRKQPPHWLEFQPLTREAGFWREESRVWKKKRWGEREPNRGCLFF